MNYYVYGYSDPTSTDPYFYIGKGHGDRYLEHFRPSNLKQQTRFYSKLKSILLKDILPTVSFLKHNLTEQEAYQFETEMIAKYGRLDLGTGCLCNHSEGGKGGSSDLSEETRLKIRIKRAVQFRPWTTEDQKVKLSIINRQVSSQPEMIALKRRQGIERSGKPIYATNLLTKEIVLTFECLSDVTKKGFNRGNVRQVLSGQRYQAHGYGWRYA